MYMHRTTILLPEDLRAHAEACAQQQGISLGELIRRQLQMVAKGSGETNRRDDPLFRRYAKTLTKVKATEKIAASHDQVLAEAMEAEISQWR